MVTQIPVKLTKRMRKIQKIAGKPIVDVLAEALTVANGDVAEAAEKVGIDNTTFYVWMGKLGIRRGFQFPNNNNQ